MKIKSIHIENFGTLHNLDLDFEDDITQIERQNGWGKTTLSVFLKAMFYSMPKKGNNKPYAAERSKYKPWQGGIYGGNMIIEVANKTYRVTRTFADTPEGDTFELIDLSTGLQSRTYTKDLGQELFGVGVETFEITAFFPQMAFASGMTDEMRANMTGLSKFENDLNSVSLAQKKIKTRISELAKYKPKQQEIDDVKKSLQDGERLIQNQLQEKSKLEKDLTEIISSIDTKKEQLIKEKRQKDIASKQNQERQARQEKILALQEQLSQILIEKNLAYKTQETEQTEEKTFQTQTSPQSPNTKKSKLFAIFLPILAIAILAASISLGLANILPLTTALIISAIVAIITTTAEIFAIKSLKNNIHDQNLQQTQIQSQIQSQLPSQTFLQSQHQIQPRQNDQNQVQIQPPSQTSITENDAFTTQITALSESLKLLRQEVASSPQTPFDEENFENLREEYNSLEKQRSLISQQINSLSWQIEEGLSRKEKLEETLDDLLQRKQSTMSKIALLEKTQDFLKQAQNNVSARFSQPFNAAFNKIFDKLAGNKQGKISVDINMNVTENTQSGQKEFEYLSQGYRDAISVCQRFALLDTIYKKEKPFILLDDPFVNLDENKKVLLSQEVKSLSKAYQTIYLHCHSSNKI